MFGWFFTKFFMESDIWSGIFLIFINFNLNFRHFSIFLTLLIFSETENDKEHCEKGEKIQKKMFFCRCPGQGASTPRLNSTWRYSPPPHPPTPFLLQLEDEDLHRRRRLWLKAAVTKHMKKRKKKKTRDKKTKEADCCFSTTERPLHPPGHRPPLRSGVDALWSTKWVGARWYFHFWLAA